LEELTEKQAMTTISKHCGVSWSTVSRTLASLLPMTNVKRNWLPRCSLVDEFRSLKNQVGPYSFSCMDGDTGKLRWIFFLHVRRKISFQTVDKVHFMDDVYSLHLYLLFFFVRLCDAFVIYYRKY
jgi:transposase